MGTRKAKVNRRGFSLLESIITIGIVVVVAEVVYSWSFLMLRSGRDAQARTVAAGVATEQLELIRNATYDDIGTTSGYPVGIFPSTQTVTRGDLQFRVDIYVDYVDDPFDGNAQGTIPNKPRDTVPADYKRVEVGVCWNARCSNPLQLTSTVSPRGAEIASNTGALFISVTDSNGVAVPLVDVVVTNTAGIPNINIINKTDIDGRLQLLSLPPASDTYHVAGSKTGYTSDATGSATNPDTSVVVGGVTEVSLFIDQVSTLVFTTETAGSCAAQGNIQFQLTSQRSAPQTLTTDATGTVTVNNLPWDTYDIRLLTAGFDIAGSDPPLPIVLAAGTTQSPHVKLSSQAAHSLLVTTLESGSQLPLTDATVQLEGPSTDETKVTNQGSLSQTDWSGGSGQSAMGDATKFFSSTGALAYNQAGTLTLASQTLNQLATETFGTDAAKDAAFTTAVWTTGAPGSVVLPEDSANPGQYQSAAIAQSLQLNAQAGKILDVTLTATETLNGQGIEYFAAADGVQFEPVTRGVLHTFVTTGKDLRWKAVLSTGSPTVTPVLNGVSLAYTQRILDGVDATLTSSTFDTGAASTFSTLAWNPATQLAETGPDALRFQIASNNDDATWNYVGPDGTAGTYYTVSGTALGPAHAGHRYLRYRVLLHTDSLLATPQLNDLSIIHSNACLPPGQVFFSPLPIDDDYTLTVSKPGYQTVTQIVAVAGATRQTIPLNPNP